MARRDNGGIWATITCIYGLMILIKNCCIFWNWICCSEISRPSRQWATQYHEHRNNKKRNPSYYNYLTESPRDGHDDNNNNNSNTAIPEDVVALAKPRYGDTGARENTAYIHDSKGNAYVALGRDLPNYYRVYPRFCNAWTLELLVLLPLFVIGIVLKKGTTFFDVLFSEYNILPQSALYYLLVGVFIVYIPLHLVSAVLLFFYRIIKYPMKSIIYRPEVGYVDIRMNHVGGWSSFVTTAGCIFAIINPILYPIILCILLTCYPSSPEDGAITGTELSIVALVLLGLVGAMQFCLSLRAVIRRLHHHHALEHYHATFPSGVASACDGEVVRGDETTELASEEQLLPSTMLTSDGSINQHHPYPQQYPSVQQQPSHTHSHHGQTYYQPPHPQYTQQHYQAQQQQPQTSPQHLPVTTHDSKKDDDAPPAYQQHY